MTTARQISRHVVKSVLSIETPEGDGVTVRRSIGTSKLRNFTPFLMLDHFHVPPGGSFPDHPHRGMVTATYMLKGFFDHEDFVGHRGRIGPGDLQFMIAGKGIMHAEMPVHEKGLDDPIGLQLWIDLPKQHKLVPPSYQELNSSQIPTAHPTRNTRVKVICGESDNEDGETVSSPVRPLGGCWYSDWVFEKKGEKSFQRIPKGWNSFIYTLSGQLIVGPSTPASSNLISPFHTVILSNNNIDNNNPSDSDSEGETETGIYLESASEEPTRFVIISGEPLIGQEIVQHGPFVMDSQRGILEAFEDFREGKNGFEGAREWRSEIGKGR
ncbi:hypothetical protein JCM5350_001760 [Sporobolomyces pararoseus]